MSAGELSMQGIPFASLVLDVLLATPIRERLGADSAVVLERVARGGGATKWYYCSDHECLALLALQLSPGSAVSFYFEGRMGGEPFSAEVERTLRIGIHDAGELLMGTLGIDGLHIDMEIISGSIELNEFLRSIRLGTMIFYGTFPARDNDGMAAITVMLPDRDGVVRAHPH